VIENQLVTVIIPAYNRVDYVDQAICSVLDQTYSAIQLIVIDDGSSDGTIEKVQTYINHLELLSHPGHSNRGQSASINLGLERAQGKYIAILDSDDYWESEKIEKQVAYLECHPDIGLVYSNGYAVDSNGNILYSCHGDDHQETNDPGRVLLDCYFLLPQNALVRKSVYDKVGKFDESYRAAQDHDMLIRISEVTRFAYIPDYLWYYRRHSDSISSRSEMLRWKNGFRILDAARLRYPYDRSVIRKRRAVLNYRLGCCYYKDRKLVSSLTHMITAAVLDPLRAFRVVLGVERKG